MDCGRIPPGLGLAAPWYRFLRTPIGLSSYWTTGNWIPYLLFPPGAGLGSRRPQFRFDRLLVLGFAAALFAALYALTRAAGGWSRAEPVGPAGVALLGLVAPYLVWSYLVGLVDLVHHTHPRAICFSNRGEWDYYTANVRSTTHMVLPLGLNWLSHNIFEHTAHHVDPRVPLYHLPDAQDRLEAVYTADVPVERLTPGYVLGLMRTCRLYDYERRQWLDYDGTPTTPAQHPISTLPTSGVTGGAAKYRRSVVRADYSTANFWTRWLKASTT